MSRAVMPWTWCRVLRDHGPKNRDFICAMLTLRTWMDESGFAYPGLRVWAAGARMAVNTLRKHLDTAVKGGWLAVEVSRSRSHHNIYRCAVPAEIELPEKDELLALSLVSQFGEIDDGVLAMSDTRSHTNGSGVLARDDTRSSPYAPAVVETPSTPLRVSNGADVAYQSAPYGVSENRLRVSNENFGVSADSHKPLSSFETRREVLKSEVLEVFKRPGSEEGAALPLRTDLCRTSNARWKATEPEEIRLAKAAKLLHATPDISDDKIIGTYGLTRDQVLQLRGRL